MSFNSRARALRRAQGGARSEQNNMLEIDDLQALIPSMIKAVWAAFTFLSPQTFVPEHV